MKFELKEPTPEAADYADAIQTAIMAVSARLAGRGKRPLYADPISALLGILGSFVAGAPEHVREPMMAQIDDMLRIAVRLSLEMGSAQPVHVVKHKEGPLQ